MNRYIICILVLIVVGILYEKYKIHNAHENSVEEQELIKRYYLNKTLAGDDAPIIWIHVSKDINARWWANFYSRNSTCVNQPYEMITVKSIIDKCGGSFNVCLIDDNSFKVLLPNWKVNLDIVAEPIKSKMRELALAKLLYTYGGLRLPASFLCLKDIITEYDNSVNDDKVLMGELLNRSITSEKDVFTPSPLILGCRKECPFIDQYIEYLQRLVSSDYTAESVFDGSISNWFKQYGMNKISLLSAQSLGVLDTEDNIVTVERLASSTYVPIDQNANGIYFPADEILRRTAYQWLSRLSPKQMMESNTTIGKQLLVASHPSVTCNSSI